MLSLQRPSSEFRIDGVFFTGGRCGRQGTLQEQVVAVLHVPLDGLALLQAEAAGQGGGNSDVPLLRCLTLDELDFGGVSHGGLLSILVI
jgi:hypothetical protein